MEGETERETIIKLTPGDRSMKDSSEGTLKPYRMLGDRIHRIYLPGEEITNQKDLIKGHGTYENEEGNIASTVAGIVTPLNRLLTVASRKTLYLGDIGDVVVGRVTEVLHSSKRWSVDISSRCGGVLMLSSITLPGGELRKKFGNEMHLFKVGDLISAEVHSIFHDGSLSLHMRNIKYGLLGQGILVNVSPNCVRKNKSNFYDLPLGVRLIVGSNGWIWITFSGHQPQDKSEGSYRALSYRKIELPTRENMVRIRNSILAMNKCRIPINDTSVMQVFERSECYSLVEMLKPDVQTFLCAEFQRS